MKKPLASLAFAALAALCAFGAWTLSRRHAEPKVPPLALGASAPDFTLADLAGKTYSLSRYRGQVVLVNFWATWCPSCRDELPALEGLFHKYNAKGLVILAPSVDEDGRKALLPFLASHDVSYPVLLCDPKTAGAYQIFGLPTSFLIDAQGRLARVYAGPLALPEAENDILQELNRRNS